MSVHRMVNPVKHYAWGSRDGIATLQRRPAAERPEAELWMGAHPQAPSALEGFGEHALPLDEIVTKDPCGVLGADVVARFGSRLPFMVKLLSAAEPLSLQVHPDDALASEGFARQDAAGVGRAAMHRVYRDPYGKPEILFAISRFHALVGFRPAAKAAAALAGLRVSALQPLIEALRTGRPTGHSFVSLLEWPAGQRAELVTAVATATRETSDPRARWISELAERYPADPAVVGILLLNYIELAPGHVVHVAPGQIHAYLQGTGVELLGGSDNVVRAGLTPKHTDLGELHHTLNPDAAVPVLLEPVAGTSGWQHWPSPHEEFGLSRLRLAGEPARVETGTASILLCLSGKAEISTGRTAVVLGSGESAFVTADPAGWASVAGSGVLLRATAGVRA